MIDCRQTQKCLDELTLLGPDPDFPDDVQSHLAECAACRESAAEREEAWYRLPSALPREELDPKLEQRLMTRIAESVEADKHAVVDKPSVEPTHSVRGMVWRYVLAASVLVALISASVLLPLESTDDGRLTEDEEVDQIQELARQLDKLDEIERVLGGADRDLQYVSLHAPTGELNVRGYLLYDAVANQGHFFGFDLEARSNRYYRVWILGQDGKPLHSVDVDLISEKRIGSAVIDMPESIADARAMLVTLERVESPLIPSDEIQMHSTIDFQ